MPAESRRDWLRKVGAWFDEPRKLVLVSLIAVIGPAAGSALLGQQDNRGIWTILIGALAAAALIARELYREEDIREKENSIEALEEDLDLYQQARKNLESAVEAMLRDVCSRHGLKHDDRVSLYAADTDGWSFQVGRHSSNPNYAVQGRPVYPLTRGLLGEAWAHGHCWRQFADPNTSPDEYQNEHLDSGLTEEEVQGLTMPSRRYFGVRLNLATGPVGVVMFESERARNLGRLYGAWKKGNLDAELLSLAALTVSAKPVVTSADGGF